jgi:hypothetical protein
MRIFSTAMILTALLLLPAGAAAKPNQADKRAAIAQCKSERGKTSATRKAFKAKYHSFSRCVRENTAEEAAERKSARKNAAKECRAEDPQDSSKEQPEEKGHGKGRNAFGKCVSAKAKEHKQAEDAEDAHEVERFKNAAKQCQAESRDPNFAATHDGKSFEQFYGTNRNRRNAFGKCVSSKTSTGYTDPLD